MGLPSEVNRMVDLLNQYFDLLFSLCIGTGVVNLFNYLSIAIFLEQHFKCG